MVYYSFAAIEGWVGWLGLPRPDVPWSRCAESLVCNVSMCPASVVPTWWAFIFVMALSTPAAVICLFLLSCTKFLVTVSLRLGERRDWAISWFSS